MPPVGQTASAADHQQHVRITVLQTLLLPGRGGGGGSLQPEEIEVDPAYRS